MKRTEKSLYSLYELPKRSLPSLVNNFES